MIDIVRDFIFFVISAFGVGIALFPVVTGILLLVNKLVYLLARKFVNKKQKCDNKVDGQRESFWFRRTIFPASICLFFSIIACSLVLERVDILKYGINTFVFDHELASYIKKSSYSPYIESCIDKLVFMSKMVGYFLLAIGMYFAGKVFWHSHKKFLDIAKNGEKIKQKDIINQERFWFYSIGLPCEIFAILFLLTVCLSWSWLGLDFWAYFFAYIDTLSILAVSCLFGYFYLLYHLIYLLYIKIFRRQYVIGKRIWVLAIIYGLLDTFILMVIGEIIASV